LLDSLLGARFSKLKITGIDISKTATALAKKNFRRNVKLGNLVSRGLGQVQFERADLFDDKRMFREQQNYDAIISNPPYISVSAFRSETTRSVKTWEPELALVPKVVPSEGVDPADVFYDRLLHLHKFHNSRILVMEVDGAEQARRVVKLAIEKWGVADTIELWRDWPEQASDSGERNSMNVHGRNVLCKGTGHVRAVAFFSAALLEAG